MSAATLTPAFEGASELESGISLWLVVPPGGRIAPALGAYGGVDTNFGKASLRVVLDMTEPSAALAAVRRRLRAGRRRWVAVLAAPRRLTGGAARPARARIADLSSWSDLRHRDSAQSARQQRRPCRRRRRRRAAGGAGHFGHDAGRLKCGGSVGRRARIGERPWASVIASRHARPAVAAASGRDEQKTSNLRGASMGPQMPAQESAGERDSCARPCSLGCVRGGSPPPATPMRPVL